MSCFSRLARVCLLGALVLSVGCAGNPQRPPVQVSQVQVPPRLDLGEWGAIGIVEFDGGSDPKLAEQTTRRFVQMLQAAQPGARILELGDERRVLTKLGHDELDFEAVRALGERYRVDAVFTGLLELGEVKPQIRFGQALAALRARADVTAHLSAKLLETHAGALVWSRSSTAKANVARLGVPISGLPSFGAKDPTDTHAGLIQRLVAELRYDFYPTWE
jgi:hypothetical protein